MARWLLITYGSEYKTRDNTHINKEYYRFWDNPGCRPRKLVGSGSTENGYMRQIHTENDYRATNFELLANTVKSYRV